MQYSCPTGVSSGVRQDGILSPDLFNLYVADDLVVFSPSSAGFQQLLNICTEYGVQCDIKYNAGESAILLCRAKQDKKKATFSSVKLSNNVFEVYKKVKYLGHFIADQMNDDDDDDIYRQCCKLYAQANTTALFLNQ